MKNTVKKSISLFLTLCMVLTMLAPMAALAEDTGNVPSQPVTQPWVDVIVPSADADVPQGEDNSTETLNTEAVGTLAEATVPEGPCTVQDGDPAVRYTDGASGGKGAWAGWPETNSDIHFFEMPKTAQDGETFPSLSLTFKGTGIAIYGQVAKNGPMMSAVIDGLVPEDADFFSDTKETQKVYEKNGLSDGEHTLVLTFTREYSGSTTDIAGSASLQAAIDRFEIVGPPEAQAVTVVSGTTDKATAFPGDTVTITAADPAAGMEFRSWTSSDGVVFDNPNAAVTTFTMSTKPVTVTAGYKLIGSEIISPDGMTATSPSEEGSNPTTEGPASLVLDGKPSTFWCTDWNVHPTAENRYIMLDLGGLYNIDRMTYVERPNSNGCITEYDILVSTDGKTFHSVATGNWVPGNKNVQPVDFTPALATHVKLLAVHTQGSPVDAFATAAELRVSGVAIAPITQAKGVEGNVKLNFDATQFPDEDYKYYYSDVTTAAEAPTLGEARDGTVYANELTNGAELTRAKREYVNVVLVDGTDNVVTFHSIEVTLGEPQEYLVTVIGDNCTVSGGGQDDAWLPEGGTATIAAPEEGEATMTFHHWSSEDGVVFADPTSATTTFPMLAKPVTVKANYAYPAGTTFYLDSENGDDTNTGLAADVPWKTLGKMDNVLLQPGDKVLLKAGSVFGGQSLSLRGSGSAEKPIIVDMYDGAVIGTEAGTKPVINANGIAKADFSVGAEGSPDTVTARPNVAYGVHIKNVSHIKVNNLEITNNSGTRQMAVGLVVEAASGNGVTSGIHLNGLYVHNVFGTLTEKTAPNGGIFMITTPGNVGTGHATRYDDISVQNCSVVDVSRTGISVGSSHSAFYWEKHPGGIIPEETKAKYGHTNVVIRNNYVENAGGDAIVPQFCISPLIEYNISNGASQNTPNGNEMYNAAIWPWRCEDALFQFNEAYGTLNNGDGQAYDCDSSRGTTYQYNYSHDNGGGFILLCQSQSVQSTVRYNISQNDRNRLFLLSNTEPAEIYNNTFYIGEGLNTRIMEGSTPSNLKNNIFYTEGTNKTPSWGSFTYTNNIFYGFDNAPTGNSNITADPMFVDPGLGGDGVLGNSANDTLAGYALQEGSPAIGAGVVIENNGGRDYSDNRVSDAKAPSIGAMEYATGYHTVTVEGGTADKNITSPGDTITITATPPSGKMLDKWICEDVEFANVNAATTTFTMPDKDITVTATFRDIPPSPSNPNPKPEPPKTDTETGETVVEVPVKPTVSGDKATAKVPDKALTNAIASAVEAAEKSGTVASVELKIDAPKDAKTVETTLSQKSITQLADGKTGSLKITTPVADVSFDTKALLAIAEGTDATVKISAGIVPEADLTAGQKALTGDAPVYDFTVTGGTATISDFQGGTATVTIPYAPKEGETAAFVTIWHLSDTGTLTPVEGVYKDGTVTFAVGHFSRYAIGYLPFTDVKADWSYSSIVYAYNNQLLSGVGGDAFAPGDNMTRAMFLTALHRVSGKATGPQGETWYANAVAWAVEAGISDGTSLEREVTRQELATILYRYNLAAEIKSLTDPREGHFVDETAISVWAAEAAEWCRANGIITGKAGNRFAPSDSATRAEVAVMLERFIKLL